ncbi:MAG TPA: T9SS type A sorting domain-containing protein [Chitinophagaceae bacterium]|nr:T9SS type A sorting domain-containing protein [Chitinophagaceae bacterium]
MKSKTLLLCVMTLFIISVNAQKKEKQITGYAITAVEKGGRNWKEVRLVDINTGQELRSVYQSSQETEALNARTGKPVVKKEITASGTGIGSGNGTGAGVGSGTVVYRTAGQEKKKVVNLDDELNKVNGNNNSNTNINNTVRVRTVVVMNQKIQTDKPFSTNSAAMAYDKKHERLYYTPMAINQLRYIDLKSGKIYYFEDEAFGTVKGLGDAANQITRMVIASDGNGYALTNDGNHLIRFTTGKKPTITDLGALSDDAANGNFSVHNPGGYGGDMIADVNNNLYLVTANRNVFKFPVETKVATHMGTIKGLPRGFSTNGAMVEEGSKVIVASSESTVGYYRFDLNTMQAEQVSEEGNVFNASDLANGNLAFEKKKKEKKEEEVVNNTEEQKQVTTEENAKTRKPQILAENSISVFPNPTTTGNVKVSFNDIPAGKYQVQVLDLSGKLIRSQDVVVSSKMQIENINLPDVAKGSYLIKVVNEPANVSVTSKLVVQ